MSKIIMSGEEAQKALKRGVDAVGNAVKITLGPKGRNVVLSRGYGAPSITNDGVSIAREIFMKDPVEDQGAQIIKEVGQKQDDTSGDGTTTAIVIAQALVEGGMKATAMGGDSMEIRNQMNDALGRALTELDKMKIEVVTDDDIRHVASVAAESEEIGAKIAELVKVVGKDGVVAVEEGQSMGITYEHAEGMEFDKGFVSPYMTTDDKLSAAEFRDVRVLVTDRKIGSQADLYPLLSTMTQAGETSLVIIAEDIEGEALAMLVVNKMKGGFRSLGIKAPSFGNEKKEILKDIAVLTGATLVSDETGTKWENVDLAMLGRAKSVISTKDKTTIVGSADKDVVETRVEQIRVALKTTEGKFDRERLESRIAKLSGGVAVIKVGATTDTERSYIKDKITDAVKATKAAIAEGIVPGGGAALLHVAADLSFEKSNVGGNIVIEAMRRPFLQIIENGGLKNGEVRAMEVVLAGYTAGYDAKNAIVVKDMFATGIVDPVKITKGALERAVSAAGVLLTTEVVIAEEPKKDPQ